MAKRHNRRQRKKLHIGEFRELGFEVSADLARQLDDEQREALLDAFLSECIEANGMLAAAAVTHYLDCYIVVSSARGSATEEQRERVRAWLAGRSEFSAVTVGPLTDAWHGHD